LKTKPNFLFEVWTTWAQPTIDELWGLSLLIYIFYLFQPDELTKFLNQQT
jgi:hypothetical protein